MLYYWMSAAGVCFILKYGKILTEFRYTSSTYFPFLNDLYKCCLCMGFWVGLGMIYFLPNKTEAYEYFIFPFSCSAFCWFMDSLISLMLALTYEIEKDN